MRDCTTDFKAGIVFGALALMVSHFMGFNVIAVGTSMIVILILMSIVGAAHDG